MGRSGAMRRLLYTPGHMSGYLGSARCAESIVLDRHCRIHLPLSSLKNSESIRPSLSSIRPGCCFPFRLLFHHVKFRTPIIFPGDTQCPQEQFSGNRQDIYSYSCLVNLYYRLYYQTVNYNRQKPSFFNLKRAKQNPLKR